jgi:hypothetical protein
MAKITLFGIPLGHPPNSHDSTILSSNPSERIRLAPYRRTAVQLIAEHDIELPGWEALTRILEAALSSRDLYFAASLHHPSQENLDEHFAAFVLSCAQPVIESEAA